MTDERPNLTNEHPEWPPPSTGAGTMLRMTEALGRPGRPRRAAIMGFAVLAVPLVVIVVAILLA